MTACTGLHLACAAWLLAAALTWTNPALAQTTEPAIPYVVLVDYSADAANFDALKGLIEGVARASIAEPGCLRFDVMLPVASPGHILLWEVFDDAVAFKAHSTTAHFKQFVIDSGKLGAARVAMPGSFLLTLHKP